MTLTDRQEILLTEYKTCQEDITSLRSHYWVVFGVFIPINTALFGAIVFAVFHSPRYDFMEWVTLAIGLGMSFILYVLFRYLRRVNFFIWVNQYRMRYIDSELGMAKNILVQIRDKCEEELTADQRNLFLNFYEESSKEYVGNVSHAYMPWVYRLFIVFWALLIIFAFFLAQRDC